MQEHRNSLLILEVNLQLLRADGQLAQRMNLKPSRLTGLLQTLKQYQIHKNKSYVLTVRSRLRFGSYIQWLKSR